MMSGWVIYGILIFANIATYIMIQMYFEGHEAFNEIKRVGDFKL